MTACSRRQATRRLLEAAALAYGASFTGGCGPGDTKPPVVARVPLADLASGRHATVTVGEHGVDLVQVDGQVRARLLVCTHMGCKVAWHADEARYACPCHQAAFDGEGRPVAGPALTPLLQAPFELEGEAVIFRAPAAPGG